MKEKRDLETPACDKAFAEINTIEGSVFRERAIWDHARSIESQLIELRSAIEDERTVISFEIHKITQKIKYNPDLFRTLAPIRTDWRMMLDRLEARLIEKGIQTA